MWVIVLVVVVVIVLLKVQPRALRSSRFGHWPLSAQPLLTPREQQLYHRLRALYPNQLLFVQVALSQLLKVAPSVSDSWAIRNHFIRLVADFALCRADFSVIAIIELDDASHSRSDRIDADRRKALALESAGIPLVRIPAGALPSDAELKRLIELKAGGGEATTVVFSAVKSPRQPLSWRRLARGGVGVLFLLMVIIAALSPETSSSPKPAVTNKSPVASTSKKAANPSARNGVPAPKTSTVIQGSPSDVPPSPQESMPEVAPPTADARAAQKASAWDAFYQPPSTCEHPPQWSDQVECANQYMRAKKAFDAQWASDHPGASAQD